MEKTKKKRNGFASGIGFILAAAGSAVGLGNLWSFPYKTSANGGAAFVFIYILSVIVIGSIVMIAEIYLGKRAQANPVTAYAKTNKNLGWLGLFAIIIPFFIITYYSVLGGYTVKYTLNSFGQNSTILSSFTGNIGEVIIFTAIFLVLALVVVMAGVKGGIEKASKILMPALFILLVAIVIYCLTLKSDIPSGVAKLQAQLATATTKEEIETINKNIAKLSKYSSGLDYYLNPDFTALGFDGVLAAMGQAFFSLSLGMGIMVSYGSYTGKKVKVGNSVIMICIFDSLVALLGGLAIFPAIASLQAESLVNAKGVGLLFSILPAVFDNLGTIGHIVSFAFFGMVVIAALTSVISLLEVVTQFVIQKFRINRKKAILIVAGICFAISIPVGISLGMAFNTPKGQTLSFGVFGKDLLTYFDDVTNAVLMPICALGSCIALGWFIEKGSFKSRFNPMNTYKTLEEDGLKLGKFGKIFAVMVKYVTPLLILLVEVMGVISFLEKGAYGLCVVLTALGLIAVACVVFFTLFRNKNTGCNADEIDIAIAAVLPEDETEDEE